MANNLSTGSDYFVDPAFTAALPGTTRQAEVARGRFLAGGRAAAQGVPGSYNKGLPALRQAKKLENSPFVRAARSPVGRALGPGLAAGGFYLDLQANQANGQSATEAATRAGLKTGGSVAGTAAGGAACGTAAAATFGLGAFTCPVLMGGGAVAGGFLGGLAGDGLKALGIL